MIYLDNNATTMIDPVVVEAMTNCYALGPLNPSSQHAAGRQARRILDETISQLGGLLHAAVDRPDGDQLILTSGGTESNNLALFGIGDPAKPLVVSSIEHPSVMAAAVRWQAMGREVRIIPALRSGCIDLDAAIGLITSSPLPSLVSLMSANNETGVVQPLAVVAEVCRKQQIALHVDATQTIGKLPFDFAASGAAAVTFTAHKFHGPVGVGGLLLRSRVKLSPALFGGEQQLAKRPGTEAVPLVVGMSTALQLAVANLAETEPHVRQLRDTFERQLVTRIPETVFHGQASPRLPGTSCFSLLGADRQALLMALDLGGVACSSGSACASGSSRPSPVLTAMGCPEAEIESALRVGISKFSTAAEINFSTERISLCYKRLRKR